MNPTEKLVVIQAGAIKYVGTYDTALATSGDMKLLTNVGQVVTQRQAMPGQIAGTVVMTKSVTIVSLDFCKGPVKKVKVRVDAKYTVDEDHMPKEDVHNFMEAYEKFLNGDQSV